MILINSFRLTKAIASKMKVSDQCKSKNNDNNDNSKIYLYSLQRKLHNEQQLIYLTNIHQFISKTLINPAFQH